MDKKQFPQWDDKYSLGNIDLDFQNKQFFDLASKIEDTYYRPVYHSEIRENLIRIFSYMKDHFLLEEEYIQSIGYPYFKEHKQMHRKIVASMIKLIQNIKTTNDLKEKLYFIVSDWLLSHILEHDMMVKKWEKENPKYSTNEIMQTQDEDVKKDIFNFDKIQFIYLCQCANFKHILPYQVHLDIQCNNKIFKCKKCQQKLCYMG